MKDCPLLVSCDRGVLSRAGQGPERRCRVYEHPIAVSRDGLDEQILRCLEASALSLISIDDLAFRMFSSRRQAKAVGWIYYRVSPGFLAQPHLDIKQGE
jgi:hypothetical protein